MLGSSVINVSHAANNFTVLSEVSGVYKFTLDASKEYLVVHPNTNHHSPSLAVS